MGMLVLTRKLGEKIILTLADGIRAELVVLEVRSGQVKIGIDAPRSIGINRAEIQSRIDRQEHNA